MDDKEQIVVSDYNNNRIQGLAKNGENIFTFGDIGPEKLLHPLSCFHINLEEKERKTDSLLDLLVCI